LFISKLRISGFKSFCEDTTITISSGLNGIIGPNGSGKSNIVEAIKWVMGENSSKSLRGSGMNDLIFSGSASKASKNIALVSITIEVTKNLLEDNYKKFLKDNIIQVERQAVRDSGSTYRINGKEVKAKDIQFLFADFSSGSRSSNIIDQGSVGNLVLQKPIERRKVLDEAAGISGISARKNETNNKLDSTRRNLLRLNDILLSKKKNLQELQKQAKKAISFKEAQKKTDDLKEILLIAKWRKTRVQLKAFKSQLESINLELNNKKEQLIKIKATESEKENILNNLTNEQKQIKEKSLLLNLDVEKINFELNSKKNDLISLKNLKIQINKNINFQKEILENSKNRITELNKEMQLLSTKDEKKYQERNAKKILDELKSSIFSKENKIKDLNLKFNEEKHLVSHHEFERSVVKKDIEELSNLIESTKKYINEKIAYKKNDSEFMNFNKLIIEKKKTLTDIDNKKKKNLQISKKLNININSLKLLAEKEEKNIDKQKNIIYDIEKKISNYLSLGYKASKTNILNEIKIKKDYMLALCLAIGDGIEADSNEKSPVKWSYLNNIEELQLPKGLKSLNTYIKGPKKLKKFLSQVAIVENNEEGNKYQKQLKNGQIIVTKQGSLWRWDGLIIIDGKQTFTFKRIDSTTKILQLEKKLVLENKILLDIKNKKIKLEEELKKYVKKFKIYEFNLNDLNNQNLKVLNFLNDADKKVFVMNNIRLTLDEEITNLKNKLLSSEKNLNIKRIKLKSLANEITNKSSKILNINKLIIDNKSKLEVIKQKADRWQISFALEKQKNDTLLLKNHKNLQEIKETEKKSLIIQEAIDALENDLKEAEQKIILIELNPSHSNNKINILNERIKENNQRLDNSNSQLIIIEKEYKEIKSNITSKKIALESLKEKSIRKDTQIKELTNFLEVEENNIKNNLNISFDDRGFIENKKYDVDIKNTESELKKFKFKIDEYNDINFSAEKDANQLEEEVNNLDLEEKDLTKAAKKLEKAIEELNKESRSRVLNAFNEINNTFSFLFKKLFSGGKAYLELVDSSDPLQAGLELMVSPPGKKLQRLSLLSGGEKALASLALIFSTFINKTSPICILDEVDAPLDEGNVEKFCELLKEVTNVSNNRFLVVTHNKITMGFMNKLYGITMLEPGSSKVVSVNLDEAESVSAAE
tara:strand:+ start:28997 stop:32488 length:3492 start_codon:yes stop_codon:yes gene_type:complete